MFLTACGCCLIWALSAAGCLGVRASAGLTCNMGSGWSAGDQIELTYSARAQEAGAWTNTATGTTPNTPDGPISTDDWTTVVAEPVSTNYP